MDSRRIMERYKIIRLKYRLANWRYAMLVPLVFFVSYFVLTAQSVDPQNAALVAHFHPINDTVGVTNGRVFETYSQNFTFLNQIILISDPQVIPSRYNFQWSPNGNRLAVPLSGLPSPLNDTVVQIWDMTLKQKLYELSDINSAVGIVWNSDETKLAAVASAGRNAQVIRVYDAQTGQILTEIDPPTRNAQLTWSSVSDLLVFESFSDVQVWDANTGNPVKTLNAVVNSESGLESHPSQDQIAFVNLNSSSNDIEIWNIDTGQMVRTLSGHTERVIGLDWSTGGLVSTSFDNSVRIWDLQTGQSTAIQVGRFARAELNASGTILLVRDDTSGIQTRDPITGDILATFNGNQPPSSSAGPDQTVTDSDNSGSESVTLDGSASSDSDGTITSHVWTENSTQIATGAAPTVDLAVGTHTITLTVTDNDSATATDEVVITVNAPTSVTCDATVPASDVPGLVSAINTANGSGGADTICLEASTYTLNAVQNNNYGPNGLPAITSEITLVGLGGGATIERVSGSPSFRFFRITSGGTLTLDNLTLSGGDESNGGAIYNEGTLTLDGTTLQNNTGGRGGGIRNDGGTVTLTDSTISGNTVTNEGGGVYSTSSLTLTNTTLSNNSADDGGGIYNTGGTVNISGGTISGNDATGRGGGIRSFNGGSLIISNGAVIDGNDADIDGGGVYAESTVTITDSTISGNNAVNGGGIYSRSGTLTLIDSTVSLNNNDPANPSSVTSISGGGIYNFAGNVSVMDTLIDDNAVGNDGAGIYNATDTLTVTRSVISNNNAGSRSGGIENRGIADITLTRIENNTSVSQGGGMFNTGTATLTDSCVMGNTSTNSTGVGSSVSMDAEHVWWGDASGPGGWAGGSGDGIGTSVSALPYLENGCYEPRTSTVIANLAVASSRDYDLHSFQLGARAYTDRTYSFNQVPNELSALIGAVYVRPSQNDKAVSSPADFMTFSLEQNATLYVLWDNRLPTPSWLSTWTDTGHDITTTDSGGSLPRSVFSQSFNAGQVTLPPPTGTTNSTTYMVVAVPQ